MKRAWYYFSKEEIEDKDAKIKSILFALCYFHSIVIERRRFGPKGWNMMYPFNMGDLRDSYLVMYRFNIVEHFLLFTLGATLYYQQFLNVILISKTVFCYITILIFNIFLIFILKIFTLL
jgi:hypothetical protein